MRAGEGTGAVGTRLAFTDHVIEEPEAHGGVAVVAVAIRPGIQDQMRGAVGLGDIVGSGEGVGDVVLGLRPGSGELPRTLLDALSVLGAAAREDVIHVGGDEVVGETASDRFALSARGKSSTTGDGSGRASVGEDLVPVVGCWCGHLGYSVAIELKRGRGVDGGRYTIFEPFQPQRPAMAHRSTRTVREAGKPTCVTHEEAPVTLEVWTVVERRVGPTHLAAWARNCPQLPAALATDPYLPRRGWAASKRALRPHRQNLGWRGRVAIRTWHRGNLLWRADLRRTICLLDPYRNLETAFTVRRTV